jgi:hypothetical protein
MEAHKDDAPPPLEGRKIRKKVKKVINSALAKNIADRPKTAQSLAAELRAESEGIGALLRRALEIYSKHLQKFVGLSILLYSPLALLTLVKIVLDLFYVGEQISDDATRAISILMSIATFFVGMFCGYFVFGTTTWIVAQTLAVPLRPVHLRPALRAARKKWKSLVGTGMMTSVLSFIGFALCFFPGLIMSVMWALVASVVMMENLRGRAAMKRSTALVKRSLRTTTAAVLIMFLVPFFVAAVTGGIVAMAVDTLSGERIKTSTINREVTRAQNEGKPLLSVEIENGERKIVIGNKRLDVDERETAPNTFGERVREVVREDATSILMLPFQILIASLWSIIAALLYLKTRQSGGESLQDLLTQFEEADRPRTNWQRRVHQRLEQSGRLTGSKTNSMRKTSGAATGN